MNQPGLLGCCLATGNDKALDLLGRISPAAWQHLRFLGHYAFRDKRNPIDLEAVLAGIDWEQSPVLEGLTTFAESGFQPMEVTMFQSYKHHGLNLTRVLLTR
jgi:hypothetical protein